ncbi:MAG: GMP synthase [Sediminibacterium magnilacihabitans]|jgi:homoserine O-succinyltransferase|nr:GMP synthase [Sediminibacterium magnilacihabitans]PQV61784.1 GMP synthase-like glutamine amidotransferase [Sediminibacterium magnilacihabitans]
MQNREHIRIAILDLYAGEPNQGMRCIREIINQWGDFKQLDVEFDEFDVRQQLAVPDTSYDVYISSGGPGSPLESEGTEWERRYFDWIARMEQWNREALQVPKKKIFFICHSFQLACRYFQLATVCKRKSTAFGVFPVHMLPYGKEEPVFQGLTDPFFAVDSRDYQVIKPKREKLKAMGAHLLALEKIRPHVPFERAIMGIRFNEHFIGTQFHPEADAEGMHMYLLREDKKQTVIQNHGKAKWQSMVEQLQDPDKILRTHNHVLPNFLDLVLTAQQQAVVPA